MKYPKLAGVLGWAQEPADIQKGAFLQGVELPVVEAALESGATAQAEVQSLTDRATTAEGSLATANATIAERDATIANLTEQVATLKKSDAGTITPEAVAGDKFPIVETEAMEFAFQKELMAKL